MFTMNTSPTIHDFQPTRKIMVFVDGENLVARFQEGLRSGLTPREDLIHEENSIVWSHSYTSISSDHEILRVTYYTYVVGDENKINSTCDDIRSMQFSKNRLSSLSTNVTPCVFKKSSRGRSAKGVDIQMCIDILNHVHKKMLMRYIC